MRTMMQDPQVAAMMKQAKVQSMMPKSPKAPVSLGGGKVGVYDPKSGQYEIVDYGEKKNIKDRWMVVDGNVYDRENIVDGKPALAIEGVSDDGQVVTVGVGDKKASAWYDPVSKQLDILGDPFEFGKSEVTTIEMSVGEQKTRREKLTDVRDTLRDYQNIRELFKPEYLTLLGRGKTKGQGILDELGALDAFPEFFGKERFTNVKEFYSATQERANKYIKMITGAQMSEAEAKRLMKAIPSIEDSPNTFQAKLDYIVKVAQSSYEAYAFELASGASLEEAKMAGDAAVNQLMPSGVSLDRLLSGDVGGTPGFVED